MPLIEVSLYIDAKGDVSPQEVADAVGTALEQTALPFPKPKYVLARPAEFLPTSPYVHILKG